MAEQHQQLGQNTLPHLALELEEPTEAEEPPNTPSASVHSQEWIFIEVNTYSATVLRSLEMPLVFLNSLQTLTSAPQNG